MEIILTVNLIFLFLKTFVCFPASVDVKDRGRHDSIAEAGLSAAESEGLTVPGILTNMTNQTALEAT